MRIQKLAEKMNYIPNISAKSLVLHRSYNVGLFFSSLDSGTSAVFFHDVVRGVNHVIKDHYKLIVKGIDDELDYKSITSRSYDGIIVMSQRASDNPFIEYVMEQGIPQVVLNRQVKYEGVCNILSDDYNGALQMCEHIIKQGHRHIALIQGREGFQSTLERSKGYFVALEKHGIHMPAQYQVRGNYDVESGYAAMRELLMLDPRPTAVFCLNDDMAVGGIKAVLEQGLKVPDDMSIAGFDDNVFSAYLSPALTTVKRPIEQISQEGAKKLIQLLEREEGQSQGNAHSPLEEKKVFGHDTVYMNADIIIRESILQN